MVKNSLVSKIGFIAITLMLVACGQPKSNGAASAPQVQSEDTLAACSGLYKDTLKNVMGNRQCEIDTDCETVTGFQGIFTSCTEGRMAVNHATDVSKLLADVNSFTALCPVSRSLKCAPMDTSRAIGDGGYCTFRVTRTTLQK